MDGKVVTAFVWPDADVIFVRFEKHKGKYSGLVKAAAHPPAPDVKIDEESAVSFRLK